MPSITVPATKSITVSNKYPNKSIREETIRVGFKGKYKWNSFLFFDISLVKSDCVKSAILNLFKTSDFFFASGIELYIMPLLNPFSSVTTYNDCKNKECQNFDLKLAVKLRPFDKEVAVQIDITSIFNKWLDNTFPNYGLAITGHRIKPKDSGCMSFGSAYSNDNTLIPTIDVNYKLNIFCLLPPAPGLTYVAKLLGSKK